MVSVRNSRIGVSALSEAASTGAMAEHQGGTGVLIRQQQGGREGKVTLFPSSSRDVSTQKHIAFRREKDLFPRTS